jgi:hypothetical protein
MALSIYFAGSIRGGRDLQPTYEFIISRLQADGHTVLSEHVGDASLFGTGESLLDEYIYRRDISWLFQSDCVVADVTMPSLGVGYEVASAFLNPKPLLCIARLDANVSAMISGNKRIPLRRYDDNIQAVELITAWLKATYPELAQETENDE